VAAVSILDIAGDKDHRQLRVEFQNTICEIETVHVRHHHIGYERNVGLALLENTDAFDSIGWNRIEELMSAATAPMVLWHVVKYGLGSPKRGG
jgi:hypothetical protein